MSGKACITKRGGRSEAGGVRASLFALVLQIKGATGPIRETFTGISGRRARSLDLADLQKRVISSLGAEFRAALRTNRCSDIRTAAPARDRDFAAQAGPAKRTRAK